MGGEEAAQWANQEASEGGQWLGEKLAGRTMDESRLGGRGEGEVRAGLLDPTRRGRGRHRPPPSCSPAVRGPAWKKGAGPAARAAVPPAFHCACASHAHPLPGQRPKKSCGKLFGSFPRPSSLPGPPPCGAGNSEGRSARRDAEWGGLPWTPEAEDCKSCFGAEAASRPWPFWTARYLLCCPDGETEALSPRHTREGAVEGAGRKRGQKRRENKGRIPDRRGGGRTLTGTETQVESWVWHRVGGSEKIGKRVGGGGEGGQAGRGAGESPREAEKEGGTSQSCKTWLPCLPSRARGRRLQPRRRRRTRTKTRRASSCRLCKRPRVSNWFKNRRQRDRTGVAGGGGGGGGGAPCKSESDGNPTTEEESSRSPENLDRGVAAGASEAPTQSPIFLTGASPPTPGAPSSILVNGGFLAAGSSPAVLLNGSPVIINSLALGEASGLGPLLLTGGGAPPPPQPSAQGASQPKAALVLDPQTGEVRLEEPQPEAPETKGAQMTASGLAGEEASGALPQVVPGPIPAATFPLPPGPVPTVAAPQLLAAGPGSPVKVAATAGPANVHLINSGLGVTALQLPTATAPGNFLLANPVSGSPIVTGVAVQQGKIILTATFPTSMLVSQVLPLKPEPAISVPEGALPVAPSPALPEPHTLGTLPLQPPPPGPATPAATTSLPFSPDSAGLLPGFPAPPPEGLMLSSATVPTVPAVPVWPAGLELSSGTEGLLDADKGMGTAAHPALRMAEPSALLLGATAGAEVEEGLEAEAKVLTQLQSVPVEEPLEL
ncbi:homeobox protein SIX5 isoform X2 [Perognathus longimembris pacificus]|uniref:homeobox protein SIX5 isoform X2 n=1 Tax=Perognathus longimembris pacificus TaxID=214514 RepID=UPI00201860DB|nr:homeobox protein SIX5 isoform X2 [Perognathus longimembris pacificus]